MTRERRIQGLSWTLFTVLAVWFLLAGWPLLSLAVAQEAPQVIGVTPVTNDPLAAALLAVLQGGGLPAVLGLVAWWARGLLAAGLSITVQLSTEDRARADRLIRVLDRRGRDLTGALSEATSEDRIRGIDDSDLSDEPPVRR